MTPSETVTAFIRAVERKDLDAALELLGDEISYENMPIQPITGKPGVRATLEAFLGGEVTDVDWQVLRQVESGTTVVNERLDRFRIGDGWLELPVAGVFEVDAAGRITLWRDYFDMNSYVQQRGALTGG